MPNFTDEIIYAVKREDASAGGGNAGQVQEAGMGSNIGIPLILAGAGFIQKNSEFARAIFPRSAQVLGARGETSLASLVFRRISTEFGVSFLGGQAAHAVPILGWGLTMFDGMMMINKVTGPALNDVLMFNKR